MKILRLSTIAFLALFTFVFYACKKDAGNPSLTSRAEGDCCVGSYSETLSTLFSCGDASSGYLTIVGQNDANSITFTINRTGKLNKNIENRFTRVEYTIKDAEGNVVAEGGTEQSDNAPKTTYSFTYTLSEGETLASCAKYTVYVVIKGLEGFNALPVNCANEWAGGNSQGQGVFAKTFEFTVRTVCEGTPPTCGSRTQTLGYYGSSTNSAGYRFLSTNWSRIGSVTIGDAECGGKTMTFTSAKQVNDFIKKQGTGNILVLPSASTFSAQVLTLSLNVRFFDGLQNMLVKQEGPFFGMTVAQVLSLANQALAGCPGVLNFTSPVDGMSYTLTLSQINNIVDAINNSRVDGKIQTGNILECPE